MARDKTERLLNLMIALSSYSRPVSREELRTWLIDQYGADQTPEAFEKMFERDKDELRGMGIPVETVFNSHNEVIGYRIDSDKLKMSQLRFTGPEIAVLNTARALWSSASATSATRTAMIKLEASAGVVLKDSPFVMALGATFPDGLLGDLLQAINDHKSISFEYQRQDGALSTRKVAPWGVASRGGHWYLVGFDEQRQEERVFRISRIVGKLSIGAITSNGAPVGTDLKALIGDHDQPLQALVSVVPGVAAGLRRRHGVDPQVTQFEIGYDNLNILIREILSYAPYAQIIGPSEARDAFVSHIQGLSKARV